MLEQLPDLGMESHRVWWTLLRKRVSELAPIFPRELRGCIQFEVENGAGQPVRFYLRLQGPSTKGDWGAVTNPDALVRTSDLKLQQLLFAKTPPSGALVVTGDFQLFQRFFGLLAATGPTKSIFQIRGQS